MWFRIIGPIRETEVIAEANSLQALRRKLRNGSQVDSKHVSGRAVCLNAGEYKVDLHVGRRYRVIRPQSGDWPEVIRIVDGSGEDYLYPAKWFRIEKGH